MKGKILVVEDEPIVALDLQQEVELLGLTVVGQAESADEALMAAEETRIGTRSGFRSVRP